MFDRDIGTTPALMVIQVRETQERLERGGIRRVARSTGKPRWASRGRRLLFWIGHLLASLGERLQQVGSPQPSGQASRSSWATEQR